MFKKFLLPLPVIISLFFFSLLGGALILDKYTKSTIVQKSISCTFVSWYEVDSHIAMELSCDGKKYKTTDIKLINNYENNKNTNKYIEGDLRSDGYVVSPENKDK
jgi:hypothetical protein